MARQSINIRFPFEETYDGGVFAVNTTTERALRDDLVSLLTTKRRQRVMRNNLYSPIFDYLDEPLDAIMQQRLEADIKKKVDEFIPQIDIKKIKFENKPEQNLMGVKIIFSIKELFDTIQTVELNIPTPDSSARDTVDDI
jgi:phage baseplate assembly protein W